MKFIQLTFLLLISAISVFAQENGNYPFDNQIIIEKSVNGQVREYPQIKLMIGAQDYMATRLVMSEDDGAQYMLSDFKTKKFTALVRMMGQKVAVESTLDIGKIDAIGIGNIKAVENKKVKKEILGSKCRVFEGERDNLSIQLYVGKISVPAKGLQSATQMFAQAAGIQLQEGEVILGAQITDKTTKVVELYQAKSFTNRKYTLSTSGYSSMNASGFGF